MISIIICSRTEFISAELKSNIEETIGVEFEIILINNSENRHSIFEAYNKGVEQSSYPFLCFMHDDIKYYSKDWGKKISTHFEDTQTGAIGIAGTPYAASLPGSWWGGGLVNQYLLPLDNDEPQITVTYKEPELKNEVVLLDGVWFCIRKELFDRIRFDSKSYTGFHFYDVDISLQVQQSGYKLYSIFDVLIRHYTRGIMNQNWCENAMIFHKKWQAVLPLSSIELPYNERCEAGLKTLKEYIYQLLYNNYPRKKIYKLLFAQFMNFKMGWLYYKTPVYFLKCAAIIFSYSRKSSA
jgi:GT2 family glycosyltransferase